MSRILLLGSPYQTDRYRLMREALAEHGLDALSFTEGAPSAPLLAAAEVVVLDRHHKGGRDIIGAAPRLRALISPIAGIDHIDVAAATEHTILVGRGQTPENTIGMAEATIALLLACLYEIPAHARIGQGMQPRPTWPLSSLAQGKTLGLIGFGKIASAICQRLAGWNIAIKVYSRFPVTGAPSHVTQVSLDDLLATSDIVSLHTTLSDQTRGMIDAAALDRMKQGVILINTARAALIDEAALAAAVRAGKVRRVALDALDPLPVPPDSPLRGMPDAILTPHMIGHTQEGAMNFIRTGVESVRRVVAGEPPLHVCNPSIIPEWVQRWGGADDAS